MRLQPKKEKKKMIDICKEVENAKTIGISGHIKPDGDCIGSTIGLCLYLRKRFPDKEIVLNLDEPAPCFDSLPCIDIISSEYADKDYDVYFAVDTIPSRMGGGEKLYNKAGKKINIDHHISNKDGSGDVNYIDPKASSASELIYRLIDKSYIDRNIAAALYIGIVHDTGVFQYASTSPETLRAAADLVSTGFDFYRLVDETYYEKTYLQNLICAKIVSESELFLDGKVIVGKIDMDTMNEMGATSNDFDGVINQLRITKGVETAVFMYPMNQVTLKVSLRSKMYVDVSKVAEHFGGGGHVRAAGFYYKDNSEGLTDKIIDLIKEQI